jgi:hypothetical protein
MSHCGANAEKAQKVKETNPRGQPLTQNPFKRLSEKSTMNPRFTVPLVIAFASCFGATAFPSGGLQPVDSAPSSAYRPAKTASTFYPTEFRQRILEAVARDAWAASRAKEIVAAAQFWSRMSDEQLWELMFAPTLPRSWHVWSSGHCPACNKSVPMYNWVIDAQREPWKVRCPHCGARFPTNDFAAFYRSGLNERGIFDPQRADRSLLFHAEHPNPDDPKHRFGVDDGQGYRQGDHCWRFIGAYLIYGQWKQLVVQGLQQLSAAYLVTGDRKYARKAAILLDRVADLHPTFDFRSQAFIYDVPSYADGYVTVWHDACEEVRVLALCYDAIFEAVRDDPELVTFLSRQAEKHAMENRKRSFSEIQANLEYGLIHDPLRNARKIASNFPRTPFTQATLLAVLGDQESRQRSLEITRSALAQATAVDGVTGEKGLSGYAAFGTQAVASWLSLFDRFDQGTLPQLVKEFPLRETFRFHLDTWALGTYYPRSGDAGNFARKETAYVGMSLEEAGARGPIFGLDPVLPIGSGWTLLWRLYELTGDVDFVRLMYHQNGRRLDGLPYDLAIPDPGAFRQKVAEVLDRHGTELQCTSVNKESWAIALLRSGREKNARVVWLDYDAGGGHGHADGMTLGLFALGLDLLPDFGYPLVQYGGWSAPKARWYMCTPAHNTVTVDGNDHRPARGRTVVWAERNWVRVIRANCPEMVSGSQFDRTIALVDRDDSRFYVLDVFRVTAGSRHDKFVHPHFSRLLLPVGAAQPTAVPMEESGYQRHPYVQIANWRKLIDRHTSPQMSREALRFTWIIEDRYGYLPAEEKISLTYFEASQDVKILCGDSWIVPGFSTTEETFIPSLIVRREKSEPNSPEPLHSTFVSIFVPHRGEECPVSRVVRLSPEKVAPLSVRGEGASTDSSQKDIPFLPDVALEVCFADGYRDRIFAWDQPSAAPQPSSAGDQSHGQLGKAAASDKHPSRRTALVIIRYDPTGQVAGEVSAEFRPVPGE